MSVEQVVVLGDVDTSKRGNLLHAVSCCNTFCYILRSIYVNNTGVGHGGGEGGEVLIRSHFLCVSIIGFWRLETIL